MSDLHLDGSCTEMSIWYSKRYDLFSVILLAIIPEIWVTQLPDATLFSYETHVDFLRVLLQTQFIFFLLHPNTK